MTAVDGEPRLLERCAYGYRTMFSALTSEAIFLIELTSSGIDFSPSPFSIAVRTTRHSFTSASFVWFGAISSIVLIAGFRALNLM